MNKLLSVSFVLALVACSDTVPSTEPGADIDVSTFDLLDVTSPELAAAVAEADDGLVPLADLGAGGALVYLDPSSVALDGATEEPAAAQARALAPQCWQRWYYPNQQVQGTAWVCYPREGGGQLCFPRTVWFTVTVSCDNRLSSDLAPPNGTRCGYVLNGVGYTVAEPSSAACGFTGALCQGSGGDPENCAELPDPC